MEKIGKKTRDIRFYSEKNQKTMCVHSNLTRSYAKFLEEQDWVLGYEISKPFEQERFVHISQAGLRKECFQADWASDFYIIRTDGRINVLEAAVPEELTKQSVIQKLEFSRRYWSLFDVDWKVLLITNSENNLKEGDLL